MNDHNPIKSDKIEDELVAYLDGELDAAARQQVEERLGRDTTYRSRLQSLQHAWDLLDVLPRTSASESFTRSTVEMVALSAAVDIEGLKQTTKKQFRWAWLFGSGGALVVAVIGYIIVSTMMAIPDRELLCALPVLANLDYYRQAGSMEFLRQLDREGLFSTTDRGQSGMISFVANQSMNDRRKQLLAAPASRLGELQSSQERFRRLSRDEQQHMLRIHEELAVDPQAPRLRQASNNMSIGSNRCHRANQPNSAAFHRQTPPEIKRLVKEQEDQQFSRIAQHRPLPPDDTKVIFTWLDGWIERNTKQIEEQLPPLALERLRNVAEPQRHRIMMYAMYLRQRQERVTERPGTEILAPAPPTYAS